MKTRNTLLILMPLISFLSGCTFLNSSKVSQDSSFSSDLAVNPSSDLAISDVSFSTDSSEAKTSLSSSSSSSLPSSLSSSDVSTSEEGKNNYTFESSSNQAYISWGEVSLATSYGVYYKDSGSSSYLKADSELIKGNEAYILGLRKGECSFKIVPIISNLEAEDKSFAFKGDIKDVDRSGYADFDLGSKSGIGAYKADGSLKDDAQVIYVDDNNKNTIKVGSYTGLVKILQNQSKIKTPLDIRIKGSINTNGFIYKAFTPFVSGENPSDSSYASRFENDLETTYTDLNNLSFKIIGNNSSSLISYYSKYSNLAFSFQAKTSYKDIDSCFANLDVSGGENITLEGVGKDAIINRFGFTFSKCNSIEVKNLTFKDYQEDACSFQGGSNSDVDKYKGFWMHNCVFNKGKNSFDLTQEQDKHEGDGASDFKYLKGVTSSYNVFYKTHKTGLIGGSDSALSKDVTFHHNYYNQANSRCPLGRRVNLHAYNNYYYKCSTAQDMRASSYTLSEFNYFDTCTNAAKISSNAVIKSFNDTYSSCGTVQSVKVTDRTIKVINTCKPDGTTDYSSFDVDSTLFYYDTVNKISKVENCLSSASVKESVPSLAGILYK